MTDQIRQTETVRNGDVSTETTRVKDNEPSISEEHARPSSVASRLVWFIAGILLTLLAFRFVFILLGANRANAFADFIYDVSHPFAAPFFGLFNYDTDYGVAKLELSTLVAMAVYALVAYAIVRLLTIRHPE
jgi:uncharacterized protein YggT (Ycf19 family)